MALEQEEPKVREFVALATPWLENLYERWKDEHEYEEWEQYTDVMKEACAGEGIDFVSGRKRPFGMTFRHNGKVFTLRVNRRHTELIRHN